MGHMMVGPRMDLETGVARVRAVFESGDAGMSIVKVTNNLYDLTSLMWVSYYLSASKGSFDDVTDAVHDSRVERITYNSPFEIWLTISAITGSVTTLGLGLTKLFSSVQDSRLKKSDTDVTVLANQLLMEQLRAQRRAYDDVPPEFVEGATSALSNLATIEIQND